MNTQANSPHRPAGRHLKGSPKRDLQFDGLLGGFAGGGGSGSGTGSISLGITGGTASSESSGTFDSGGVSSAILIGPDGVGAQGGVEGGVSFFKVQGQYACMNPYPNLT
jgi:hypothetical protein